METSSAAAASGSSAPMAGNVLAPTGAAPASGELKPTPGPVQRGADGKPLGPQYVVDPKATPQELAKKFAADRAARSVEMKDAFKAAAGSEEEAAAEGAEVVEGETAETPTETPVQEGESEGKGVPAEAESADVRLARIQAAVVKAKSGAARYRQLQSAAAQKDQEIARLRQQHATADAAARRGAEFERQMLADPIKALEQRNVTADELARRVMIAGTPEEKIAALQSQLDAQAKQLAAEAKRVADERAQARYQTSLKAAEDTFVEMASNEERYPNLKGHPRAAVLAMGKQIAQEAKAKYLRETGTEPTITDRQILGYMNRLYQKAPSEETAAPKTSPSKAVAKPTGKASTKPASPRTMPSAQAAGSFVRPTNWEKMSRVERVNALRKNLGH